MEKYEESQRKETGDLNKIATYLEKNNGSDATYEIIKDYSYYGKLESNGIDWIKKENTTATETSFGEMYYNNDFALIGNTASCFIERGGRVEWVGNSGIFALGAVGGNPNSKHSFRPVLIV